jgi:hypothetical protein
MSDNAHDPRFDRDLEALSRVYRGAAQDEPPAELDAAIRAAARREVQARPQPLGRFQLRRWRTPLAAAAVIVLSVSTVMVSMHERPDEWPQGRSVVLPQLGGAPSVESQMSADEPGKPAVEAAPAPPAVTAPAPAAPTRERKAKAAEQNKSSPPAARADAAAQADNAAPKTLSGAVDRAAPAEAAAQAFSKSLPAAPAPPKQEPAPPAAAGATSESVARQSAKAFAEASEAEDKADPEKWIKQISELRKEGKTKEAAESLVKFRARYPSYPIPREWLEKP